MIINKWARANDKKVFPPLLTAATDYPQALGGNILQPCRTPPAWPPSGHRCPWRAPPSWPPPPPPHPPPPLSCCHYGRSFTPLQSSSFSVQSASCSCSPSRTPCAFTAPSPQGLKTHALPTEATWRARTPPIGAVPQMEMLCEESLSQERLISDNPSVFVFFK